MGRHTLLAVAALLVATATAPSAASAGVRLALVDGTPAPQRFQRWVDHAAIPAPARTVTLHVAACPGGPAWAGGCALPQGKDVYMLPHAAGPHVLFHELGHVFDATELTTPRRKAFQRIVELPPPGRTAFARMWGPPGRWRAAPGSTPPIEQFAEAYSLCARKPAIAER